MSESERIVLDEQHIDALLRLRQVLNSTQEAEQALDAALAFIAASNQCI